MGQLFRKTVSSKEQRELVILVTPQILNSLEPLPSDVDTTHNQRILKIF